MKNKLIFLIAGFFVFSVCFVISSRCRDYFYEKQLRENIHKVKNGMTEDEVTALLGKPTQRMSSDSASQYWCYETDTISHILDDQPEIRCSHLLTEISSKTDRVIKVFDFN